MSSSTPSNNPQTSGSKGPLRSSQPDTLINLLAGGMGGTAGAILTCPLEVVKTRLQSSNSGFIPPSQSKTTSKTTSTAASKVASSNPSGGDGGTGGKNSSSQTVKSKAVFPNQRPLGGITANLALDMGKETRTGSTTVPHAIPARGESLRQAHHRHGGVVRGQMQLQQSQIRPQISSNAGINYGSVLVRCSSSAVPAAVNPSPVPPPGQQMGVLECLRFIIRHEGVMGLFKGLGPNLVGVFPSRAIYFWAYSTAKRNVNSSMPKRNRDTPFVHVVSAGMAGFTASSATNPIWLIKTRLQLDRASGAKTLTVTNCMRKIYSELGFFGFWKGVTASYWGISETVIHFVLYEFFKKQLAIYNQRPKDAKEKTFKEFVGYMLCGACSKTCATIVAYPHEVARTRLREEGNKYRSFWQTIFKVGREEGRRGLYRGLATQLVRQIPNTAVMMSVYELTVYTLTRYYHQNYATVETNSTMIDNGSSLNRGGASTPDKGDTIEPSIGQKSSHGQ